MNELTQFAQVAGLAALAVATIEQILKLKIIPAQIANKYPVPTNIVLSIIAAIFVSWQDFLKPHTVGGWIGLVSVVSVVAAITYNQVLAKWSQLREMEG